MTNREIAIDNMRKAFTLWEKEYRKNPESFMDDAAQMAKTTGNLGELRAIYFSDLLDKVRKARKTSVKE